MGARTITAGFLSALLACTGGAILVVQAAETAGLSKAELISWLTSAYIAGGLLNLCLTLKYKIPFAGAHSITAAAFLGTAAAGYSYPQLAGAFVMSGLFILLAGCTGVFSKAVKVIPGQLIDALLAGLVLTYVLQLVPAGLSLPYSGLFAGAGFFLLPLLVKRIPPALGALLFGLFGLAIEYRFPALPAPEFILPMPVMPQFTMTGLLSLAIPMSLLILSNDLAVAMTSFKSNRFDPPVDKSLIASGAAGMAAGFFGGNAANVGGLMSALCSSPESGPHQQRYLAAALSSLIVIGFGAFAWRAVDIINVMPASFIQLMTGFSLLGLFLKALGRAFSNKPLFFPSILTFAVAALHVSMFGISTPIWALGAGIVLMKGLPPIRQIFIK
ncbi:benzoate/H(+) symporter BenE family transporter [Paenibacillus sp. N4]|uniref:benzoate/H(+) symporter BenE family transporter n=1 Tax=Paenibacillus vietnamensis TaxID=2590547 RepID=UPI001CD0FBF6|nr:benzoate/H(+) symporter BenE family transporter [Paenibacillus vietnamensis]MCA0755131.1 benzoate/H(+) symporter BenE family transporter [Paenibacillus vietnamensis]